VCGYVWAKKSERAVVAVENDKSRQTYYGALDIKTNEFIVKPFEAGNGKCTVGFIKYLQQQSPNQRIVLIWDGAKYHQYGEMQSYLEKINAGLSQDQWPITCIKLAPNAPEQNPVESAWLKIKNYVRQHYYLANSFDYVKNLFIQATKNLVFDFDKLNTYIGHLHLN
jgi:transposase